MNNDQKAIFRRADLRSEEKKRREKGNEKNSTELNTVFRTLMPPGEDGGPAVVGLASPNASGWWMRYVLDPSWMDRGPLDGDGDTESDSDGAGLLRVDAARASRLFHVRLPLRGPPLPDE